MISTSASATTTAEARFRLDYPLAPARAACVIAIDDAAVPAVENTSLESWDSARFFRAGADASGVLLTELGGETTALATRLDGVDAVIMIVTDDSGAHIAATIGAACSARSIMTAGIVLADFEGTEPRAAVAALRPFARVLIASGVEDDLNAMLVAIRA
ncbi:hypothetical protein [Glaciihabitans sp. UYNi722]|uniref:hypothetical protein n=1 Tax=Glaciihabitans sp. UYNi722 TaxID=3156344 RepID=UPI0033991C6D